MNHHPLPANFALTLATRIPMLYIAGLATSRDIRANRLDAKPAIFTIATAFNRCIAPLEHSKCYDLPASPARA
jgi:hypothetical protein